MEQARHAASTKRHSRHELQNRRKRKPVFLRMMGVLLVVIFGVWGTNYDAQAFIYFQF